MFFVREFILDSEIGEGKVVDKKMFGLKGSS